MTRRISGLAWANRGDRPDLPMKGTKHPGMKAGLKYEAEVAQALPVAQPALWWHFCDSNGPGWCQTDFLLRSALHDVVLEAKLTYTEEAWTQLEALYLPVVSLALGRPAIGLQICKRFRQGVSPGVLVATSLGEALALASKPSAPRVALHWLGPKLAPPLWPLRREAA